MIALGSINSRQEFLFILRNVLSLECVWLTFDVVLFWLCGFDDKRSNRFSCMYSLVIHRVDNHSLEGFVYPTCPIGMYLLMVVQVRVSDAVGGRMSRF